jgi:molybdopterin molybdotransferase
MVMKGFFNVTGLDEVLALRTQFSLVGTLEVSLLSAAQRILAADVAAHQDLPPFARATMDGFAVSAASTFGASESSPAFLAVCGDISMGERPAFSIGPGQAAKIPTGGMLPDGADSVVMIEHTEKVDESTIEVVRSVAPGQHILAKGEDVKSNSCILSSGQRLRPQELGLLAAFGHENVQVYKQPVVGIISTGDEVVPVNVKPAFGQIRDINTYTLAGLVLQTGGVPKAYGVVRDDYDTLYATCALALAQSDMVLISGGSSVGMRDFTLDVLAALDESEILVHGISISPGKPTILARSLNKPIWGIPGQVTSAMVVFSVVVAPFIRHMGGLAVKEDPPGCFAQITRNVASAQGRVDYLRVRLFKKEDHLCAEPILGKSGLINTMVKADGLVAIDLNTEGLDKGTLVWVNLL